MDLQLRRRLRAALLVMALPLAASIVGARDVAQYSEVEQLRLDNLTLKQQLGRAIAERHAAETRVGQCYAELGPLAARANDEHFAREVDRVKGEIEKAHPGFMFNVRTGKLDPKPAEPATRDQTSAPTPRGTTWGGARFGAKKPPTVTEVEKP